jgi:hypothetical protein
MNPERPPEDNEYLETQLSQKIEAAMQELAVIKENTVSKKYDQAQLIAVQHKIDNFFLELTNEGLRPDKIAQPIKE